MAVWVSMPQKLAIFLTDKHGVFVPFFLSPSECEGWQKRIETRLRKVNVDLGKICYIKSWTKVNKNGALYCRQEPWDGERERENGHYIKRIIGGFALLLRKEMDE